MHKLLYTAAIPLLVSSTMATEFADTADNTISSGTTSPVAEQYNETTNPSCDVSLLGLSDMIPNLAISTVEEEKSDAVGTTTLISSEYESSQQKKPNSTNNARATIR